MFCQIYFILISSVIHAVYDYIIPYNVTLQRLLLNAFQE